MFTQIPGSPGLLKRKKQLMVGNENFGPVKKKNKVSKQKSWLNPSPQLVSHSCFLTPPGGMQRESHDGRGKLRRIDTVGDEEGRGDRT